MERLSCLMHRFSMFNPDAERCMLVNKGAFGLFLDCTPNLTDSELRISALEKGNVGSKILCDKAGFGGK